MNEDSPTESDRWADDLVLYFSELGGSAKLTPDLYDHVHANPKRPLAPNWQSALRKSIYAHSSDAVTLWPKGPMKRDLFRVIGELGDGHWGLRQYITPQTSETDLDRFSEDVSAFLSPERQSVIRDLIKRNQRLARDIKKKRNYTCEICLVPSGWKTSEGHAYVEAHHVIPLGESGADHERNLIVVCPGCHRMLHYGSNRDAIALQLRDERGLA
jgi:hypothetical protein